MELAVMTSGGLTESSLDVGAVESLELISISNFASSGSSAVIVSLTWSS
jgi:hypothetical protein